MSDELKDVLSQLMVDEAKENGNYNNDKAVKDTLNELAKQEEKENYYHRISEEAKRDENTNVTNISATIIKVIAYIGLIVGVISGLCEFGDDETSNVIALAYIIASIFSFAILRGFAEIIQLLEDIKNKKV